MHVAAVGRFCVRLTNVYSIRRRSLV
jgi:hypothetical protein